MPRPGPAARSSSKLQLPRLYSSSLTTHGAHAPLGGNAREFSARRFLLLKRSLLSSRGRVPTRRKYSRIYCERFQRPNSLSFPTHGARAPLGGNAREFSARRFLLMKRSLLSSHGRAPIRENTRKMMRGLATLNSLLPIAWARAH